VGLLYGILKMKKLLLSLLFCATVAAQLPPVSVPNMAALRTLTPVQGKPVYVEGYYTPNDTGACWYTVTNTIAGTNAYGGRILARGGTQSWEFIDDGGAILVDRFGARGDNLSDSTVQMQAAIEWAKVKRRAIKLSGPGPFAPLSIYLVSSTLDCVSTDTAAGFGGIIGEGMGRSRIRMTTDNIPIIDIIGLYIRMRDFTVGYVNLQPPANTAAIAIRVPGDIHFAEFRNLEVLNGGYGIYNTAFTGRFQTLFSVTFDNVTIRDFSVYGIRWVGTSGNQLVNVYFSCPNQPSVSGGAYYNEAGSDWIGQMNIEHMNIRNPVFRHVHGGVSVGTLHLEGIRNLGSSMLVEVPRAPAEFNQLTLINSYMGGYRLSSLTAVGTTATAAVDLEGAAITAGHGFLVGDSVRIAGASDALYNGTFTITAITTSTFSFTLGGSPGAPAVADLTGGQDYLSASLSTAPFPRVFGTQNYSGGITHVDNFQLHVNRTIGASTSDRGNFLMVGENNNKLCSVNLGSLTIGTAFNPGSMYLRGGLPIVGSGRLSNVLTVWTKVPHNLSPGDLVSMNDSTSTSEPRLTVATVPTAYSFTAASTGVNYGPLRTTSGSVTLKCGWVTNRSRSGNIATVTLDQPHRLFTGAEVTVRQMTGANYNNTTAVVLTIPSTTSFTYRSVGADEADTVEATGAVSVFDSGLASYFTSSASLALKNVGIWGEEIGFLSSQVITAGTAQTETIAVTMARLGDSVSIEPSAGADFPDGLLVSAYVSAANTISVKRFNSTAGSITNGNIPVNIIIKRR